jgi:hypothetical protein
MNTKPLIVATVVLGWLVAGSCHEIHAAEAIHVSPQIGNTDGAYGRFLGDTEWSVGGGVELSRETPRLDVRLEAHYFWSVGIYAHASQALGRSTEPQLFGFGVSLRPAFLPRFGLDLERGPAYLDLFLDSIAISVGGYWGNTKGGSFDQRGLELALSAAFPILPTAEGLWIEARAGARFSDASTGNEFPVNGSLLACYRWLWTSPLAF